MANCFDVIVVGGGIMGLSTAWYLVHKEGAKVLLLEQYDIPNQRNSSTSHTRIYRKTYEEIVYHSMIERSNALWDELEEASQTELRINSGLLLGGGSAKLQSIACTMKKLNHEFEWMQFREVKKRFPCVENYDDEEEFLYDPSAGFISAEEANLLLYKLIRKHGGVIKTKEKVINIDSSHDGVTVTSRRGIFHAKSVVLTLGPWIIKLLTSHGIILPLLSKRTGIFYFKSQSDDDRFSFSHHPCVTRHFDDKVNLIYSTPAYEFPDCVKFGHHTAVNADPDFRDNTEYPKHLRDQVISYVTKHFPQLNPNPALVTYCMVTMSPDEHFIIDRHPTLPNVVIGGAFSGHGFKMAPAIGQLLAELSLGKPTFEDCSMFRIDRFRKAKL